MNKHLSTRLFLATLFLTGTAQSAAEFGAALRRLAPVGLRALGPLRRGFKQRRRPFSQETSREIPSANENKAKGDTHVVKIALGICCIEHHNMDAGVPRSFCQANGKTYLVTPQDSSLKPLSDYWNRELFAMLYDNFKSLNEDCANILSYENVPPLSVRETQNLTVKLALSGITSDCGIVSSWYEIVEPGDLFCPVPGFITMDPKSALVARHLGKLQAAMLERRECAGRDNQTWRGEIERFKSCPAAGLHILCATGEDSPEPLSVISVNKGPANPLDPECDKITTNTFVFTNDMTPGLYCAVRLVQAELASINGRIIGS